MEKRTLSIIMPSLNEEKNIESAIKSSLAAMEKRGITGEVIVINDGSTDGTKSIVEALAQDNDKIKLINHDTPQGIGYSFWHGIQCSNKDIVVMFPGDNENDADDALTFFPLMNDVDIIVPFVHNIEVRNRGRRIISSLYRLIINISFGVNLNYTNGTVFYRREILKEVQLKNIGFFYQAELLIKLIRKGYLFAEVPNYLNARNSGTSKAISLKSLFKVMSGYLSLAWEIHVRRSETRRKNYKELNENSASYTRRFLFEQRIEESKQEAYNV